MFFHATAFHDPDTFAERIPVRFSRESSSSVECGSESRRSRAEDERQTVAGGAVGDGFSGAPEARGEKKISDAERSPIEPSSTPTPP